MNEFERRAVETFRERYQQIVELGPDANQFAPNVVALYSACSTCLEVLDVGNEQDFTRKYGLEE